MAEDNSFKVALESNRSWAAKITQEESSFFTTSAQGQAPKILWIGCGDSRVPETTILGLKPGDLFVHRNIANIVNPTDLSLLSAVQFAVYHVGVKHVVVCGHTSCAGVGATLANGKLDVLDIWLQPLRALREKHEVELEKLEGAARMTCLVKHNVTAGVDVLRRMPVIIEAIKTRGLQLHGLYYDLATGVLEELPIAEENDAAAKREATYMRS